MRHCVRWNENFGTTGAWDPTGCTLIETNAVETKCECVHFGAQVWQMILYYPNPKCIFILPYSALTHCWNWQNGHDNHNLSADIDLMGYQFRDRKKLTRGQWPFRSAGKRAMIIMASDVNLNKSYKIFGQENLHCLASPLFFVCNILGRELLHSHDQYKRP